MTVFDKKIVVTASFLTAVTIAMGAFGAHGLKNMVDVAALNTFETGIQPFRKKLKKPCFGYLF